MNPNISLTLMYSEREGEKVMKTKVTKVGIDKLDIDRSVFDDVGSFVIRYGYFFEVLECKKKKKKEKKRKA